MRNLTLVFGLSSVLALTAWACSDDVEEQPTGPTGPGSGGMGGGATVVSSSSSSVAATTGAGGFANDCEEACNKIEVDCGLGAGVCALASQQLMIDLVGCTDMLATCSAACLVDPSVDCAAVVSVATANPDPALLACLTACQPPCNGCLLTSCATEVTDCNNNNTCQAFITCFQACPPGDSACQTACEQNNMSAETTALLACVQANCDAECLQGQGGAGGGGGAGGN